MMCSSLWPSPLLLLLLIALHLCVLMHNVCHTIPPGGSWLVMNQFQALFESWLTFDVVPALTFHNKVRSPYLPAGVGRERVWLGPDWNAALRCLGKFNLLYKKKKKTRKKEKEEMRSGWGLKWQWREDDKSHLQELDLQGYPTNWGASRELHASVDVSFNTVIILFLVPWYRGLWADAAVHAAAWHSHLFSRSISKWLACIQTGILINPLTHPYH